MKFIKKTLFIITLLIILFTTYFYSIIYKYSSHRIDSDISKFCREQSSGEFEDILISNPFKDDGCSDIVNLYKKFDFYNYFGYSFCADYINSSGNKYMIYGYLDINLVSRKYYSVNITNTEHCYPTEYE